MERLREESLKPELGRVEQLYEVDRGLILWGWSFSRLTDVLVLVPVAHNILAKQETKVAVVSIQLAARPESCFRLRSCGRLLLSVLLCATHANGSELSPAKSHSPGHEEHRPCKWTLE